MGKAVANLFSSVSTGNGSADRVEREMPVLCFSRICAGNEAGWRRPVGDFCWGRALPDKSIYEEYKNVECQTSLL